MASNKITPRMAEILDDFRAGRDPVKKLRGRSEYGGFDRCIDALKKRGLITRTNWSITDEGRAALAEYYGEGI